MVVSEGREGLSMWAMGTLIAESNDREGSATGGVPFNKRELWKWKNFDTDTLPWALLIIFLAAAS